MRPEDRNELRLGREIKIEPVTTGKVGSARVVEVLNENTIVVSQAMCEKEEMPLFPHEVVRIFIEEDDTVSCLQGIVVSLEDCESANLTAGSGETFYGIKNIFFKHKHRKRIHKRSRVKLTAEMVIVSGFFARKSWKAGISNISPGGLRLIINREPPELGTEVFVSLGLARRKIKIKGTVKGVTDLSSFNPLDIQAERGFGVNVKTEKVSDGDYSLLLNYLKTKKDEDFEIYSPI
ncbi:MAG: PilZ domain-containing protein [Candidatus Omnitrophica bacterium]|nr:PilZ domain-containing protein [Candidatus Omnitrophota bacterium]